MMKVLENRNQTTHYRGCPEVRSQKFLFCILYSVFCILLFSSFTSAEDFQKKDSYAIGVILPLSGRYADFGEEALKGVLLAADIFKSPELFGNTRLGVEIIVKDSGDNANTTSNAVRELAEDERVIAIVGPMLSVTAFEAAKKAQELNIPIITLSQKDGLPQIGDYVFRNFMTQSLQAKILARYAVNSLKLKRIAVLSPDNPYGRGLAVPFKDEARINNANIVGEEVYNESQTDFSKEIKRLFKIKETEKKEGRRTIKTFEPTLSIDALYIPDYFDTVSLIVSHLAYFNIKGVQLLGSNGWNSKKLVEISGKYVEDAVFVDGFFLFSPHPEVKTFINRFYETYGEQPGILSAEAFDAASVIINLLKERNLKREDIRKGLTKLNNYKGAAGTISFNAEGDSIKELFILTIKNGEILQLN